MGIKERTAAHIVLRLVGIVGISLAGLTVAAASLPNLGTTLTAQLELVAAQPDDAAAHNDLGNLLVLDGRFQEAEQAYTRAIELAPESTLPRFNLGMLLQQTGRARDAAREYRRLLEIDDRHARTYYQLGMVYESRKQRSAALKSYARAFALDPDLTFPRNNPHLIDNSLATEAMLMSREFDASPSAEMPRLYGEPERIVGLMLAGVAEEAVAPEEAESGEPEGGSGLRHEIEGEPEEATAPADRRRSARGVVGGDVAEDEESLDGRRGDEASEEGSDGDDEERDEGRRQLTQADLVSGSTVGQARAQGPKGVGVGSSRSAPAVRQQNLRRPPAGAEEDPGGRSMVTGTTPAPRPRYRPAARFSTGRLELHLLPEDPPAAQAAG